MICTNRVVYCASKTKTSKTIWTFITFFTGNGTFSLGEVLSLAPTVFVVEVISSDQLFRQLRFISVWERGKGQKQLGADDLHYFYSP